VEVENADAAVRALVSQLRSGDAVLVKASRVVGLERVAAALLEWPGGRGVSPRQARREPQQGAGT